MHYSGLPFVYDVSYAINILYVYIDELGEGPYIHIYIYIYSYITLYFKCI